MEYLFFTDKSIIENLFLCQKSLKVHFVQIIDPHYPSLNLVNHFATILPSVLTKLYKQEPGARKGGGHQRVHSPNMIVLYHCCRWNEAQDVDRAGVRRWIPSGHLGRADRGGRPVLPQVYLGSVAQIQGRYAVQLHFQNR